MSVISFKCPNCDGELIFDPASGEYKCEYCGAKFTQEQLDAMKPAEEQEKIMEPFYMVDKSRSRKSGGAGLGLALTAMIAKQHNISIQIDSKEGNGTRIILQFV